MKEDNNKKKVLINFALFIIVIFAGSFLASTYTIGKRNDMMGMDEKMELFLSMKADMTKELLHEGDYRCCLEKPCGYCLANKGECDCLEDVLTGKHPCGECMGEIMEGHGNEFLAPYFATAIAEKLGEKHLENIKEIISDKYDITIEDQI